MPSALGAVTLAGSSLATPGKPLVAMVGIQIFATRKLIVLGVDEKT
jgi:hypothetical protein